MTCKTTIEVVEKEGEKLFRVGELMFDLLEANYPFIGGSLVINRQNQIIGQTIEICEYGTHASFPVFEFEKHCSWAEEKLKVDSYLGKITPLLQPADFEVGDVFELTTVEEIDFPDYLQKHFVMFEAIHRVLPPGKQVDLGTLRNEVSKDLITNLPGVKKQKVIRFYHPRRQ